MRLCLVNTGVFDARPRRDDYVPEFGVDTLWQQQPAESGLEARVEYLFLLGRILYGGFFILGGINHFMNLGMMSGFVASKGVPAGKIAIIFSGLLIIVGGLCIVLGCRPEIGVLCIVVFLVPVTFMMHPYWQETDMMQGINQRVNFQKNIALLGAALLLLFIPRPWPLSLSIF
jgi:uncharacterized membrane protein YphA (DoxX/SURF4 family)